MATLREFLEVSGENRVLFTGSVVQGIVIAVMTLLRLLRWFWVHLLTFALYTYWTFEGLLFNGGEGTSLTYLFFGALFVLVHGLVLFILWWRGKLKNTVVSTGFP